MRESIIKHITGLSLIIMFAYGGFMIYNAMPKTEPTNDLFWIDSNRFHKDSLILCSPIYGENNDKIGNYIRVTYGESMQYIECLDTEDYTYQDFRDSWIQAFKAGCDAKTN